jgi:autoinducer 2-degrading protein
MIVYCVTVYVKNEHIDEFIAATVENHEGTRTEPGNIRFDVLQSAEDAGRFFLYEVYASEDAVNDHKATPHYKKWRETVADWMARPREGRLQRVICPTDRAQW